MPQKMTIRKERFILHVSFYHSAEGCLFEALYPAPLARPFFKGLLSWHGKAHSPSEVVPWRFLDFARNDHTRGAIVLHTSFTILLKGASSRHSILRLRRAPSSRGCSTGMEKRIPLEAKLCLGDFSTSLEMTIRKERFVLHTSFTILLKGASSRHSILRLRRAPSSRGCSAGREKRPRNP